MILNSKQFFYLLFLFFYSIGFSFNDTLAVFKEKNLSQQYTYIKEHLNATKDIERYIAAFLTKANAQKDTNYIAQSYYFKHRIHRKAKAYTAAHTAIDNAILFAKSNKQDSLIASFFHAKGATFYIQSNYEDALDYYLQAYDLMRTNGAIENRLTLEFDIATIKLKVGKTKEALGKFDKIIHSYDSLLIARPDSQFLKIRCIKMLNNTAKSYTGEAMYEKALELYAKSLLLNEFVNYLSGRCIAIGGMGNVYTAEKKYEKALSILDKALAISTSNSELHLITPFLLLDKGKCLYGLEKYQEALKNLEETDRIIQEKKINFIGLDETYQFLAQTYVKLGNHEKATEVYDQYIKRKNLNTDIRFALHKTIFGYDLKNEKERANKAEETSGLFKKYFIQTIVIATLSILIAIIFFVYYRNKQKQKLEKFHTIIAELKAKEASKTETPSTGYILSDEKAIKILKELEKLEAKLFFLDKKYNLSTLAKKCNTNSTYLSQVINNYKEKTFSEYMIDMRISYVLKALKNDKKLRSYTIQSIAEEIGFKKSESFAKAFKKRTGFNPSFYIKNLENL